jgi:hypothetical protein
VSFYVSTATFFWLIGGGNRSTRGKPLTCRKSLTNFITYGCIEYSCNNHENVTMNIECLFVLFFVFVKNTDRSAFLYEMFLFKNVWFMSLSPFSPFSKQSRCIAEATEVHFYCPYPTLHTLLVAVKCSYPDCSIPPSFFPFCMSLLTKIVPFL